MSLTALQRDDERRLTSVVRRRRSSSAAASPDAGSAPRRRLSASAQSERTKSCRMSVGESSLALLRLAHCQTSSNHALSRAGRASANAANRSSPFAHSWRQASTTRRVKSLSNTSAGRSSPTMPASVASYSFASRKEQNARSRGDGGKDSPASSPVTAIITLGSDSGSDYATYLADIIAAGQLPFSLENVKMESVGASLGERSLSTSLMAGAIGIALVVLFMILVYRLPGVIASVALLFYTALFLVVASVAKLNLSLPGIAGIILTIGMAVDANVITFERVKEEINNGKTVRAAIDAGYKHAMTAIIDSNVTTIIAALVLWKLGTGTTVGFAKTLFIGVILSMIVMLFISQFLMKCLVPLKATNPALYGAKPAGKEEN